MNLYNCHLKFKDDSESDCEVAAESLPAALGLLSEYELKNLHSIEFIAAGDTPNDCIWSIDSGLSVLFGEIAELTKAADHLSDLELTGLNPQTMEKLVNLEVVEHVSVIVGAVEDKVRRARGYVEMIDSLARRADSVFRNKAPIDQ